ncbi:MAG: GGDEF domain-containing protein [Thermoleophilaceae bacterium]|nr:GGDEF domain-containing protein [Thermoleophilaceae bacterium]
MRDVGNSALPETDSRREADAQIGALNRRAGTNAVSAAMAEVGLDARTGWYAGMIFYTAAGVTLVAFRMLAPESLPIGMYYIGLASLLLAVLCVPGALFLVDSQAATHARLFAGAVLITAGVACGGPVREAWVLVPLFVLIGPAFIYGARFSIPYTVFATIGVAISLIESPGPAKLAHTWISIGAIWMVVATCMLSELTTRRLARINRELAFTDPLTGIPNTRALREELDRAIANHATPGGLFALFALDLDNFKQVNDRFGHSVGDRVLSAVAAALVTVIGDSGLVARRGGDEFSIVVHDALRRDLGELENRIEAAIIGAREQACPGVTASGSVAHVLWAPGDSPATLLKRADDQLHMAKGARHAEIEKTVALGPVASPDPLDEVPSNMLATELVETAAPAHQASGIRAGVRALGLVAERWSSQRDPRWLYSAAAMIPPAISLLLLTLLGQMEPLPTSVGLIVSAGYFALFCVGLHAARHYWAPALLEICFGIAIALTCWAIWQAGPAGTALLDILAVVALYALYFLGARKGAIFALASMGAYAAFAVFAGYDFGTQRAVVSITVVSFGSILLLKVREVTLRFVREHEFLSETDSLTGLSNMRALRMRVAEVIDGAASTNPPTMLTVDLDKFKLVNDRHNHTVGDETIVAVARAISGVTRGHDLVARRGGDEFFILIDDMCDGEISAMIERLRGAIAAARREICPELPATASIGRLTWAPGVSADEFVADADLAMQRAKRDSRPIDDVHGAESAGEEAAVVLPQPAGPVI